MKRMKRLFAAGAAAILILIGGKAGALEVGETVHITASDLPPPYATDSARQGSTTVDRPDGAGLSVPPGFTANLFADGLSHPREFEVLANGDVLVSQPRIGEVTLLRDSNGDGRADARHTILSGMAGPYGLVHHDGVLYIADLRALWAVPFTPGATSAEAPQAITEMGVLGDSAGHWTRSLTYDSASQTFYVGVGSRGNIAVEDPPRATVMAFDYAQGAPAPGRVFASGLRNPVGIAVRPGTDQVYTVVNERDGMGDDLVPDYLAWVEDGAFYGWPYAYAGGLPQPDFADRAPDLVDATRLPEVLFQAHSAAIGLAFYDAEMFPQAYRGDAFVTFRGSWNRDPATGYVVVRVPFSDSGPVGGYEVFATGFRLGDQTPARVWGRPTGLAVAADGALLVADDTGGTIWRIAYDGM